MAALPPDTEAARMAWRGSGRPHGNALLTQATVAEIRELKGRFSSYAVGDIFDISYKTVQKIWNGKTWRQS
jgi:hypothetical protein